MNKFPWREVAHLGLGRLRLAPHVFWRSTLRELMLAAGFAPALPAPELRQTLSDLMERFPDE